MRALVKFMFTIAMFILGIVSICTTYISLNDSILPEPKVMIPITPDFAWNCSVLALGLSVAIGLMLLAIKMAVIDGHKRLNIFGVIGLTLIAFISITFNLDVLYRMADQNFFMSYSEGRMKSVYEDYLVQAQGELGARKAVLLKDVAKQEGELDAEIRGLRKAPEGYGQFAKQEDYRLTVLQKTTEVEVQSIDEALAQVKKADELLASASPDTIAGIEDLQNEIRVAVKDVAAASGIVLPQAVKLESPLFAVFAKLFDFRQVGVKEIFVLIVAFLLDLGDILGYTLVPNRRIQKDSHDDNTASDMRVLDNQYLPPHLREFPSRPTSLPNTPKPEFLEQARSGVAEPPVDVKVNEKLPVSAPMDGEQAAG